MSKQRQLVLQPLLFLALLFRALLFLALLFQALLFLLRDRVEQFHLHHSGYQ